MRCGCRRDVFFISWMLLVFITASCSATRREVSFINPDSAGDSSAGREYRIQVGDKLDVKFFYNPELNEQITVRPDGYISLQLVQEIKAAGLTPAELRNLLVEKYSTELDKPEITVIVRSFSSYKIFVGGEVGRPGIVLLSGPMTALQSISRAEGFRDSARLDEVLVIRRVKDRKPLAMRINLERALNGEDLSQDIPLMPYDVVFVPKSRIANVNKWVDQYIRKMLPVSFGFYQSF